MTLFKGTNQKVTGPSLELRISGPRYGLPHYLQMFHEPAGAPWLSERLVAGVKGRAARWSLCPQLWAKSSHRECLMPSPQIGCWRTFQNLTIGAPKDPLPIGFLFSMGSRFQRTPPGTQTGLENGQIQELLGPSGTGGLGQQLLVPLVVFLQ